jgi:uncharacterized protein (TIGR02001 family)
MSSKDRCSGRACLALFLGLALCAPAQADEGHTAISGNVAVVSDYLFRGISQTNHDPALQAGIEYDAPGGFYAGAWGSNISWLSDGSTDAAPISSSLEIDGYAGWHAQLASGITLDAGLYGYAYPGSYPGKFTNPDTLEAYASVGYAGLSLKYSHALTNLFGFVHSRNSHYLDLSWSHGFGPAWTLSAHVGHQTVEHTRDADYSDWNLVLGRTFSHDFAVTLGYYDTNARRAVYTNAHDHYLGRATAVLSLSKGF